MSGDEALGVPCFRTAAEREAAGLCEESSGHLDGLPRRRLGDGVSVIDVSRVGFP